MTQRVIQHIAVAVQTLAVFRRLHYGVGLQKPAQPGIINPSVHVNDTHRIHLLVTGVSTGGDIVQG